MDDVSIQLFDVSKEFLDKLRREAVPEEIAREFPNTPIIVDINKAADQYGLRLGTRQWTSNSMNMNAPNILSEHERLYQYHAGEKPPGMSTSIVVESTDYEKWLERILVVMELIVKNAESWPDDGYWQRALPDWLLGSFKQYTPEELTEIHADRAKWGNLHWSFGSWLNRMRDRTWIWWSVVRTGTQATIILSVDEYPFSTKALEHLILTAGGRMMQ